MNKLVGTTVFAANLLVSGLAHAAEQTVKLDVLGMSCASCPYIVKQSLAAVDGVKAVEVSMAEHNAKVTFDDTKVQVSDLIKATTDVGFPSEYNQQGG